MSDFAATVAGLASYGHGSLMEAVGYGALTPAARETLTKRLVDEGLHAGLAVGGSLVTSTAMDFISDRSSGWPDVRLERSDDDRLLMCVLVGEGGSRHAVHCVVRALQRSRLTLVPVEPA